MQGASLLALINVSSLMYSMTNADELQTNVSSSQCKMCSSCRMPGLPGIQRMPGSNGIPGTPGLPGCPGPMGPQGRQGDAGIPGKPGSRGHKGSKGETGRKGIDGKGLPGMTGPRGPKGLKGERGIIGTKGEKGNVANIDARHLANWKQCAWRSATSTDNGKIKECSFNKLHQNTALKVSYQGNIRLLYSNEKCNRWYFKFNGNECCGPLPVESALYIDHPNSRSKSAVYTGRPTPRPKIHRPHFFEGFCENLPRGTVKVELWVGKCSGETLGDAYTGWNSVSRIMIEEVPPSQ